MHNFNGKGVQRFGKEEKREPGYMHPGSGIYGNLCHPSDLGRPLCHAEE